jgi:acyl-coenzyme A thioesterase 13
MLRLCLRPAPRLFARPLSSSFSSSSSASTADSAAAADASLPFIARAQKLGAASLLGRFTSTGRFDSCFDGMRVVRIDEAAGEAECELTVDARHENSYGTLHGGAISSLIDIVGTMALLAKDHRRGGVSVDLNVNFLKAAKTGERVLVRGRVLKLGKTLGFTQVDVLAADGVTLLACGRHTKAM